MERPLESIVLVVLAGRLVRFRDSRVSNSSSLKSELVDSSFLFNERAMLVEYDLLLNKLIKNHGGHQVAVTEDREAITDRNLNMSL